MTIQTPILPTPEQMARELMGTTARIASHKRNTTEWLCPSSLTIYEIDSRICYAQGRHGDLETSEDEEVAAIIAALRAGEYDDVRAQIANYYRSEVHISDEYIVASWTPNDGVRLALADLSVPGDDAKALHLAADITAFRRLSARLECVLVSGEHPSMSLGDLQKIAFMADEYADHMMIMGDIADNIRATIGNMLALEGYPEAALRGLLESIDDERRYLIDALSRHRAELRRDRSAIQF